MSIDLNLAQNTISQYETGVREPDFQTLIAIADYFNVSIDYLLGRTENPNINK
ncbi:MAG: helix-turn-helix transcriptional regulator [Clostridia bacterium]|nr:helix-turn-helix transcriptional regulator [Clostridia bacterium]